MRSRVNVQNPAVRRVMQEIKELQKNPSSEYDAEPLEDNIFEWHFTIRGPKDTEFAGGIYHGRILLPASYPHAPPDILLITPNGRFQLGTKICLSISGFHPETWQPSWSLRMVFLALIAFLPTDPEGAIGSLDYPKDVREKLAAKSIHWECEDCGVSAKEFAERKVGDTVEDEEITKLVAMAQLQVRKSTIEEQKSPEESQSSEQKSYSEVKSESHISETEEVVAEESYPVPIGPAPAPLEATTLDSVSAGLIFAILAILFKKFLCQIL